jgi:hypothetical protein
MKRVLIFIFLFPAVATVSFYAVLHVLTGAVVDSLSGPGIMYLVFIVPGLVLALVDWLVAKTPIPAVIGTTPAMSRRRPRRLTAWQSAGKIRFKEDVLNGIEQMPEAFLRLLQGKNFGKQIAKTS